MLLLAGVEVNLKGFVDLNILFVRNGVNVGGVRSGGICEAFLSIFCNLQLTDVYR